MSTQAGATVFIVDDDADVRLSIQRLLKTVGLRAELLSPRGFLAPEYPRMAQLLGVGCTPSGSGRTGGPAKAGCGGHQHPDHFVTAHGDIPMSVKAMSRVPSSF